ncbi:hypothetical protein EZS27_028021 [termite gut metagenome]|uniref:Translocation and assembly module TamB C-terminal domain-containing protein n=1 Tax=termite gut metagenome TaxID=433724 RepID=A0A5J4QP32_9ZZZZ
MAFLAGLILRAGKNNPFHQLLEASNISFRNLAVGFVATPSLGINGRASIDALKIDTLCLDTILLAIKQDTTHLSIRGGIANNRNNPHWVFKSSITGEIRSNDAELMLEYENKKGEKGILLGVNVRPARNAIQIKFIPEEPVVAFRKFHFSRHNRIFIRDNFHVTADVEMLDKDGMGVRIHSLRDTTSLQNLDIELRKIRLAELGSLPYFPQITGELSADANYKQTSDFKQISVEAVVKDLTYEQQPVGDMGFGLTWLPNDTAAHYINAYLSYNKEEILTANGAYRNDEQGYIDAKAELEHFPLQIVNAFIPNGMAALSGDIDGEVHMTGTPARPSINGKLILDDVSVDTHQYGARFNFDDRAVQIKDNRMEFDDFAIYTTTTDNPFTIKGFINFQNIRRPRVDLTMHANNYTLLNARRTRESLLYGKVLVDVNSTIKGPLEALVMRGNMNIRGNTDATYVLTDSPLSVQDRLGDLVTFTSFADTLSHGKEEVQPVSLRGLDVLMTIHIDQAVRMKVDLSADRNSRLELEGGGDLSFQYTSQGSKVLNGRYTLRKGLMRYSFPVIPLKDFNIKSGSYLEWAGDITNPNLALKATERIRTSVMREDGSSRMTSFDVSIEVKNSLEDLVLNFDLEAPDDMTIQNQLTMMSPEERNKQAVALLVTGTYLGAGNSGKNSLDMGNALNSVLQSQISSIAGSAWKGADIRLGMGNYDDTDGKHTDYSFQYTQRFFNDRFQVVIGGHISTAGDNNTIEQTESFIDNVSLEYRLDVSGTRYVRIYHNKNFDSLLEGEITETGAGIVLRKRVNRLRDFIFRGGK